MLKSLLQAIYYIAINEQLTYCKVLLSRSLTLHLYTVGNNFYDLRDFSLNRTLTIYYKLFLSVLESLCTTTALYIDVCCLMGLWTFRYSTLPSSYQKSNSTMLNTWVAWSAFCSAFLGHHLWHNNATKIVKNFYAFLIKEKKKKKKWEKKKKLT